MNLPLSLLKQFVNVTATPEQIAEKLTLSGSEVEKITRQDAGISKVLVGQIKEIKPHPNADKLQLAYVDMGKKSVLEIVCGAPNIQVGQKVPVVAVGGSVPGLKIEAREVRGVTSHGMLASGRELGITDDHSGIFILPQDSKIGSDVVKLLELDEPVLELAITPNRPDCFSVRGLAREVAALFGRKIQDTRYKVQEGSRRASSSMSVRVEDAKLCQKYCVRVIEDVAVGPSPLWLANKLRQVGIRSINTIVDVTNYVMMELGQPMHAFDFDLLAGTTSLKPSPSPLKGEGTIVVRRAKKGEKLAALDENTYTLTSDMLVIADTKRPVAIAGVMGGVETAVHAETKNIVLEAAVFDSVSVRKTSKSLALRSESSARFEKGVDAAAVEEALNRAAGLIAELSGGTVLKGVVSAEAARRIGGRLDRIIKLPLSEVARLLGVDVPAAKIKSILQSLGFGVRPHPNPPLSKGRGHVSSPFAKGGVRGGLAVRVPSWRMRDVFEPADLAEEIGRMLDYNTLPKTLPQGRLQSIAPEPLHQLRRTFRQHLVGAGYTELLTYSFYGEREMALSGHDESDHIRLTNPVNDEYPYLRTSLAPWMLAKLSQNSSLLSAGEFRFFEIGKVFNKKEGESWKACIGLIAVAATHEELYRRLRGLVESFVSGEDSADIVVHAKGALSGLRFRCPVAVAHIDMSALLALHSKHAPSFTPIAFYPQVERDLGVVAPSVVQYKELASAISGFDKLIKAVELFDVYHGLGEGTSLAFRLTFGSTDRTLTAQEVDEILERLKETLRKKYGVTFR